VDLGAGIDVESLEVCILAGDDCATDFSRSAEPHGVVRVELDAPLADPDAEVRVAVEDLAGNRTELRRTVRWLLRAPPPPPARPDAGEGGDRDGGTREGGDDSERGAMVGGCSCRTGQPASGGALPGALLVGLALLARRRRRSQ